MVQDNNSWKLVYDFWFKELEQKQWFVKDLNLDQEITNRFSSLHNKAIKGELSHWRDSPQGALAEVILIDQLSRNMFRGKAESFAFDAIALILSQETIRRGQDLKLNNTERSFLYMPFMHSESLEIHEQAVKLFGLPGLEGNLDYEHKHKSIIEEFGRYPHRNEILGRTSSAAEIGFLQRPGSSF